jgi:predicted nucleic acid-binding protein
MGKALIQNIKEHEFQVDEHLLLDANVWLYTYGPSDFRSEDEDHTYNDALTKMIVNKCKLYIMLPILSEYVYRYLDKQLKLNGVAKDDLKAFRKTDAYKKIISLIEADVKEILDLAKCCNPTFENSNACALLDGFLRCTLDFNDVVIEDFCKSYPKMVLVTNDGDFKNCCIPIITANNTMLR